MSEKEQDELRACSRRGRITPTSYTNEYDFGSFKGDEDVWMEKYFDGHCILPIGERAFSIWRYQPKSSH